MTGNQQPSPSGGEDATHILVFDTETTGTDPRKDQIIELCLQLGLGPDAEVRVWRCLPRTPIDAGAQAVHGISMADLADEPPFAAIADEVRRIFTASNMLVGYNMRFDIDMLQAEYQRLRQPPLDVSHALMVDPLRLWQRSEPRRLTDAHRRFVGGDFDAAHSAAADVAATGNVLLGMRDAFGFGDATWTEIADHIDPERRARIGGTQHMRWTASGDVVIDFGKHRGQRFVDLAAGRESGYLRWVRDKDFPAHVRDACDAALRMSAAEFRSWCGERFGAAPDLSDD